MKLESNNILPAVRATLALYIHIYIYIYSAKSFVCYCNRPQNDDQNERLHEAGIMVKQEKKNWEIVFLLTHFT